MQEKYEMVPTAKTLYSTFPLQKNCRKKGKVVGAAVAI